MSSDLWSREFYERRFAMSSSAELSMVLEVLAGELVMRGSLSCFEVSDAARRVLSERDAELALRRAPEN